MLFHWGSTKKARPIKVERHNFQNYLIGFDKKVTAIGNNQTSISLHLLAMLYVHRIIHAMINGQHRLLNSYRVVIDVIKIDGIDY